MPIFQIFFLCNMFQENVVYDILQRKNSFLEYKNKKFKKSKNWDFSKGVNPWIWYKNGHFLHLFFLGNIGKDNVFYDIMVLVQEWPFFQRVFLGNIGQENVFYDILQRKNSFLGYKNKKFKKSKYWDFSKGVNPWFWSKNRRFSQLFF